MIIVCPKCGRVKEYKQKEYVHRLLYFNENGEGVCSGEDIGDRFCRPRCVKCNRIVCIYEEGEE